jgi:hypothetical protein
MDKKSKFFSFLEKFNTVLLSLLGLALLILILFLLISEIFSNQFSNHTQNNHIEIETDNSSKPLNFYYGYFSRISNTNFGYLTFHSEKTIENYSISIKSGLENPIRNLLFIDLENQQSHWLNPKHDYFFSSPQILTFNEESTNIKDHIIILQATKDNDQDGLLTEKDRYNQLIALHGDGTNYQVIEKNYQQLLSYNKVNQNSLSLLIRKNNKLELLLIDKNNLKIIKRNFLIDAQDANQVAN